MAVALELVAPVAVAGADLEAAVERVGRPVRVAVGRGELAALLLVPLHGRAVGADAVDADGRGAAVDGGGEVAARAQLPAGEALAPVEEGVPAAVAAAHDPLEVGVGRGVRLGEQPAPGREAVLEELGREARVDWAVLEELGREAGVDVVDLVVLEELGREGREARVDVVDLVVLEEPTRLIHLPEVFDAGDAGGEDFVGVGPAEEGAGAGAGLLGAVGDGAGLGAVEVAGALGADGRQRGAVEVPRRRVLRGPDAQQVGAVWRAPEAVLEVLVAGAGGLGLDADEGLAALLLGGDEAAEPGVEVARGAVAGVGGRQPPAEVALLAQDPRRRLGGRDAGASRARALGEGAVDGRGWHRGRQHEQQGDEKGGHVV